MPSVHQRIDALLTDLERCEDAQDRILLRETLRLLRDDLKLREEHHRQAEDRYRLAVDAAEMGIWDWDLEHDHLTFNAHTARILGLPSAQTHCSFADFFHRVHPDDQSPLAALIEKCRTHHTRCDHCFRIHHPDGMLCWIRISGGFSYDASGHALRKIGTMTDITHHVHGQLLAESKERLKLVTDASGYGTFDYFPHIKKLVWSAQAKYQLGLSPDAPVDFQIFLACLHPDDRDRVLRIIDDAENRVNDGCFHGEFRALGIDDGKLRWLSATGRVLFDDNGKPVRFEGTTVDITPRKLIEESLRQSEAQAKARAQELSALMDAVPAVTFMAHDPECKHMSSSGATREILRLSPGMSASKSAPLDQRPTHFRAFKNGQEVTTDHLPMQTTARTGQEIRDSELTMVFEDGSSCDLFGHTVPLFNEIGAVRGAVGAFIDITQRKKAETVLRQNAGLFSRLVEQAPMGVYVVDAQFRIQQVNSLALPLFNNLDPLLGRDFTEVITLLWGPVVGTRIAEIFRHTLDTGERYIAPQFAETCHDLGVQPVLEWEIQRVTMPDGAFGIACYFHDITQRVRLAQEREKLLASEQAARAESENANRAKDQFLAVLSHELRTPLTPVLAATQNLQADLSLSPAQREMLQTIRRNVELEATLIDDLLDVTRISQHKIALHKTPLDVHQKIALVLELYAKESAAKNLTLVTDLAAVHHHVHADPARFQQILWNLLKNAIKFTPAFGRITLRTHNPAPDRLAVMISDTGIGIDAPSLPCIFDAFDQGDRAVTHRFGGLGLGLAIAKALVHLHDGTISAASAGRNQGSTFTLEFPLVTAPSTTPRPPSAGPARLRGTILLVEDHPDTRFVMTRLLTNLGCTVQSADTVAHALHLAASSRFDLVISDIGLPDASGLDLMRQLKSLYGTKGIALSGYGMKKDRERSLEAGFETHLTKPIDLQSLHETLLHHLPR